jgi:hypothetical protein
VALPLIRKVGDERQVSDQSGRLAQRTLSGRYRRPPTFAGQIRTAADSLDLSVSLLAEGRFVAPTPENESQLDGILKCDESFTLGANFPSQLLLLHRLSPRLASWRFDFVAES